MCWGHRERTDRQNEASAGQDVARDQVAAGLVAQDEAGHVVSMQLVLLVLPKKM